VFVWFLVSCLIWFYNSVAYLVVMVIFYLGFGLFGMFAGVLFDLFVVGRALEVYL